MRPTEARRGGFQKRRLRLAACALSARASALLTFNASHFRPYESQGLAVVIPGEAPA